jgi:glycosyltransferase involved in cell wall biosynthesis
MRILVLSEGDAETRGSWSGITLSVVQELRAKGHTVITADADLYGAERWLAMARSFVPNRRRWGVKYHIGAQGFAGRTRKARQHIKRYRDQIDCILQVGATFAPAGHGDIPYALFCDSNMHWAEVGRRTGYSDAAALLPAEVEAICRRENAIYRQAAAIFTTSAALKQSFVENFDVDPENVIPVYGGPNCDPATIPARRQRRAGHLPTVLFVGKQFDRKGGPLLLSAFKRVRYHIPHAELLIIGPPDLQIDQPGVRSLGFISKDEPGGWEKISAAYADADVFCLPTRYEPFGIVFVEAAHFGLPCIGPKAWAVPEIIVDGETGFTVPPEDEAALANALLHVLRDPAQAERMGQAARLRAQREFTWSAVVERIVDALEARLLMPVG